MDDRVTPQKSVVNPEVWLQEYGDYLFHYALSRLRDADSAEEAVQETFVAALKAAEQYAGKGEEQAWLLGILKRKIIDSVRRRSRSLSLQASDLEAGWLNGLFDATGHWRADPRFLSTQPSDKLEREEFWAAFRECLGKLPQRHADVFVLREVDEWQSEKICKELEISTSNLWVLLHRARLLLAKCLKSGLNEAAR